tara:strand:+ start:1618 stop:2310 length:693 start_codon:yes stop_codon:yes gene_type:complete
MADMPKPEDFERFTRNLKEKMERAEQLGLKDYQQISMMGEMKLQGVGFFYPPDVDKDGNITKNKAGGKYHLAGTDYTDLLNMIDRTLWFNRMSDMMVGLSVFVSNQFEGMAEGNPVDIEMRDSIKAKLEKEGKDTSDFNIAATLLLQATEFIVGNRQYFSEFYEKCLSHTEPAMISLGTVPTIANIMEGGYSDEAGNIVDKADLVDVVNRQLSDDDIVNFLKELKVEEEE